MIFTLACAMAWDLNSPIKAETKLVYAVSVTVTGGGEEHRATFDFVVNALKAEAGKFPLSVTMNALTVDDNEMGEATTWNGTYSENGFLTKLEAESPDFRRMFAPFFFPFPNKSIEDNATWKFESKEKDQIPLSIDLTAKGSEADLLKVVTKYAEGEGGVTKADGTWWIGKDNKVQKFELTLHGWIVPMAGGEPVEATVKGVLKK